MAIYYHLDRKACLTEGQVLTLRPQIAMDGPFPDGLFPEGLSAHGRAFLSYNSLGDGVPTGRNAGIEAVLEWVRLAEFGGKLSRFQSIFAFDEEDDARTFAELCPAGDDFPEPVIWKVEGDLAHRGDMSLLKGWPIAQTYVLGRHYWAGTEPTDMRPALQQPVYECLLRPPVRVLERVG